MLGSLIQTLIYRRSRGLAIVGPSDALLPLHDPEPGFVCWSANRSSGIDLHCIRIRIRRRRKPVFAIPVCLIQRFIVTLPKQFHGSQLIRGSRAVLL